MENNAKQNTKPSPRVYKVLIRIMNRMLSMNIPGDWKISKIRKFLENNFQEQIKNSSISFIYSGKPITTDDYIADIVHVYLHLLK